MTPESYSESVRVKAEFRQELYKVTDSRIANLDAQAAILVAAAVAIAGFVAAAGRDGGLAGWKLALVGVIGGASALFALYARRVSPDVPGLACTSRLRGCAPQV